MHLAGCVLLVVVPGEGALLVLIPPLSLELGCDDGWSDTSSVGRAGLVGVGCRCWLVPGHRGSLALGNIEIQALPVLWLQRRKSFTAQGHGLWGWLLPQLRANMPGFSCLWKLHYQCFPGKWPADSKNKEKKTLKVALSGLQSFKGHCFPL